MVDLSIAMLVYQRVTTMGTPVFMSNLSKCSFFFQSIEEENESVEETEMAFESTNMSKIFLQQVQTVEGLHK